VTVRLLSKPRLARTAMAVYDRMDDATNTVNAVLASGVLPTSIELIDDVTARCIEANTPIGLPLDAQAVLLFGTDGNDERVVIEDTAHIGEIATRGGAREIRIAPDAIAAEKMWSARRAISPSLARRRPNKLGEDIAVPRSSIPEMARRVRAIATRYDLEIPLFGHIGDGNLHPNILCDRRDPEEMLRVTAAAREIFEAAVELGGTLSGEHGIGLLKKQFMELDLGTEAIALMRKIKDAIDPNGIMNPGKVFPDPGGADAFHL
jgi:glycolate oxidase